MNKTVETSVKLEEIHEIPPFPYRTTYVSISANLSRNYLLEPVRISVLIEAPRYSTQL